MTPAQKAKRHKALTLAHVQYEKGLTAHALFKVNDRATGDDLVQDTFLKTWRYLAQGGKIDVMKSFLYHILNNLIIDEYRKRKTYSLDIMLEKGYEPSDDSSEQLMNALDGKTALYLIQKLPATYQKVMRMKYVQNLTIAEMAAATGKSKNSITVLLHRGLAKLTLLYTHA